MQTFRIALIVCSTLLAAPAAQAVEVSWTDWQSRNGADVDGQIDLNGTIINVDYTNTAAAIWGAQLAGGADYWANGGGGAQGRNDAVSGYTSIGQKGNANAPAGTDIIQLNVATTHTLTFDQPVRDVYMSFVSWNVAPVTFDRAGEVLSYTTGNVDGTGPDAAGFWGNAPASFSPDGLTLTPGGEFHGTVLFEGTFSSLSFTTTSNESWHGFTVGVAAVPLPASAVLLLGGAGTLIAAGRRKQSARRS